MSLDRIINLLLVGLEIERAFRQRKQERLAQRQGNGVSNARNPILTTNDRDRAIRRPEIEAPQFELKPMIFQMLQTIGQFSGMPTEDPHLHLQLFIEVSDSFKMASITKDALRLKLFPYSCEIEHEYGLIHFQPN
ncbi:RING-H2 finger protein ATL63 [Gossypium australe]|uniref:RING-H2 finger protein ATL63 n=1 Tax=Gossypium australe TaxID=47621 RepID=A0A5B6X0Y0_9ROSI|nr:RING-H2 finger protein ATL63 [Gossypium australe]